MMKNKYMSFFPIAVIDCLLIAAPVLAIQEEVSCSVYDFRPYWRSVLEAHLSEILSAHEGTEKTGKGHCS